MRQLRPILAMVATMALLVACSSTPSASTGDGGGASQPAASTGGGAGDSVAGGGGGGGTGGSFANGSAKYHITGDLTADGELGFVALASQVDQNGFYSLSFSDQANTVLVMILSADQKVLSWADSGHSIPGASCDFNITRQDANGAAGTFSCDNQPLITTAGTAAGSANISGEFDARK